MKSAHDRICPVCRNNDPEKIKFICFEKTLKRLHCLNCNCAFFHRYVPVKPNYDMEYNSIYMREGDIRKAHIMAERIVKFATLRFEKPTIFEIGVGNGLTTKFIQNAGIDIEGLDIDKKLCEKLESEQHIRVYPGGLEKYTPAKQYDVVYSSHVIEHFDEPDLFLLKAKQLTKKNGYIWIDTPDLKCGIAQGKEWHHFRTRDPWEHACVLSGQAMLILATRHSLEAVEIELHPEYSSFQAILRKP